MRKSALIKLIQGQLSPEKEKEVLDYLFKNPKKKAQFEILKAKHVAQCLNSVNHTSYLKKKSFRFSVSNMVKYAVAVAVLVILLKTVSFITNHTNATFDNRLVLVTTQNGEMQEVVLDDGTEITLNAGSILSYPKHFTGNSREVSLKGEAFFKVAKNKDKPFFVSTDNGMKIKVLGTEFNVKAYAEDKNIETTLVEGRVRVLNDIDSTVVFLKPSQKATYIKHKSQIVVEKVDNLDQYTGWKNHKFIYDDAPMIQVLKDIERAYNVQFKIRSQDIYSYSYKGTFDNLTISQILDLFEISSPITYVRNNNIIVLKSKN
jgi:ferric-dicitrate binding protein FerR (iron transport regulator)